MPTYEYRCDACGHHFSTEQRITEEPLKSCPSCRKRKLQRLITSGNFLLKGGGWYRDGYAAPAPSTPSTAKPAPCGKDKAAPACATCPAAAGKD